MSTTGTVLVVDDEAPIRAALRRLLVFEDHLDIVPAEHGPEALHILAHRQIDVVISDHHMPQMSGVELLRQVRESAPDATRILLSGHVDIELLRQAVNAGEVYRFICKPWNDDELRLAVRHGCERARLLRHARHLEAERERQHQQLQRFSSSLGELVAERTQALEERNRALTLQHEVFDHLPLAVMGVDMGGTVVLVNALARRLFPEALPGTEAALVLPQALANWVQAGPQAGSHRQWEQVGVGSFVAQAMSLDERGTVITIHTLDHPAQLAEPP